MDLDKQKRNRTIRVVLTDAFLVLVAIPVVAILVAVVIGYRINSDFSIEQNGMVQIKSYPSNARIVVDGEEKFSTTEASVMVPGGEHSIEVKKDGYLGWSKKVSVEPGWLLRLDYPRLIKIDRTSETARKFDGKLKFFEVSPDRKNVLYSDDDSTEWTLLSELTDKVKATPVNITGIFSTENRLEDENGNAKGYEFTGEVKHVEWNANNTKLLVNAVHGDTNEWAMIDLNDMANSINLTRNWSRFEASEKQPERSGDNVKEGTASVRIITAVTKMSDMITRATFGPNDNVMVLKGSKIVEVNPTRKTAETLPVTAVSDFEMYGDAVIYYTNADTAGKRQIALYDTDIRSSVELESTSASNIEIAVTHYSGKYYFAFFTDSLLSIYRAQAVPRTSSDALDIVVTSDTNFTPSALAVSPSGIAFVARDSDGNALVYDNELERFSNFEYKNHDLCWFDRYTLTDVNDKGELYMRDYDGTNLRQLTDGHAVKGLDQFTTVDNKFMYFVSETDGKYTLIRQNIE